MKILTIGTGLSMFYRLFHKLDCKQNYIYHHRADNILKNKHFWSSRRAVWLNVTTALEMSEKN